jgi:hypothetical protein
MLKISSLFIIKVQNKIIPGNLRKGRAGKNIPFELGFKDFILSRKTMF